MKHIMVVLVALLIPTATMAEGECKADKERLCKDVVVAKGTVVACLKQHEAELSDACKARLEARAKAQDSAVPSKDQTKQ
jgi:hypothetical protein